MDEYLSKPLKQNHLIQTILKCATLGGHLLEKGRDTRTSPNDEVPSSLTTASSLTTTATASPVAAASSFLRPPLEPHAFTTTGPINHGSLESPAPVTGDQEDPLTRVSNVSPLQVALLTTL
jgi:osomolarity two-component system sensor histidine kinase NIK1